jgi:hypothetical protein
MSSSDLYYREPESDFAQGDIFGGIPHAYVREPIQVVREAKTKGKHRTFGLYPYPPQAGDEPDAPGKSVQGGALDLVRGETAAIFCQVSHGIVLNHDCDIENEPAHRLVALIYPLARIQNPDHRRAIENNQNYTRFYLPAEGLISQPSYIDFRRITCIHPDFFTRANRVTRVSEILMGAIFRQFFLFLTHRRLTDEALFGTLDSE